MVFFLVLVIAAVIVATLLAVPTPLEAVDGLVAIAVLASLALIVHYLARIARQVGRTEPPPGDAATGNDANDGATKDGAPAQLPRSSASAKPGKQRSSPHRGGG